MYLDQKSFIENVQKEKYQVYILSSRISIPFSLFVHTWVVIVNNGKYERYDVWGWKNRGGNASFGYLSLNLYEPWVGVRVFPSKIANPKALRFRVKILYHEVGKENSLANQMVNFLKNDIEKYPYKDVYRILPGPNSNTFTQWFISKFPTLKFKLPCLALGKNFILRN